MAAIARPVYPPTGLLLPALLLPALLLLALVTGVAVQTGVPRLPAATGIAAPETVTVAPRAYSYRDSGDFQQDGVPVDAPLLEIGRTAPLEITRYQVSAADYARCVAAGACVAARPRRQPEGNVPVTGVSHDDAVAYAGWLSAVTGDSWRLPTVAEWTFAAGSRAADPALALETDGANPAERWLANYERETALGAGASAAPEPLGSFGRNEFGVADIGGTVWEWTATCNSRTTLDATGAVRNRIESCGVRLLEGRHRAPMSAFVHDARSGGCAVGVPPDNLGFRLVRERPWYAPLLAVLRPFAR